MCSAKIIKEDADVFAIIRSDFHDIDGTIENKVAVKKVVWTKNYAEQEVKRLNNLNDGKAIYFYQNTYIVRSRIPVYSEVDKKSCNPKYTHVFAIVRYDTSYDIDTPMEKKITVDKVVRTKEEAEAEIDMLNIIDTNGRYKYFYTLTRLDICRKR